MNKGVWGSRVSEDGCSLFAGKIIIIIMNQAAIKNHSGKLCISLNRMNNCLALDSRRRYFNSSDFLRVINYILVESLMPTLIGGLFQWTLSFELMTGLCIGLTFCCYLMTLIRIFSVTLCSVTCEIASDNLFYINWIASFFSITFDDSIFAIHFKVS